MLPGMVPLVIASGLVLTGELDAPRTLIVCALALVACASFVFADRPFSTAVYHYQSRVPRTENQWRKQYLLEARGFVLLLRSFERPTYFRLQDRPLEEFVVLLVEALNGYAGGVVLIGGDDLQDSLPAVVLRPPDERWPAAVAATAHLAHRIVIIPESSGGLEYEMRALVDTGLLERVIVCIPPDPASAYVEAWNDTVARYRQVGFALPPYNPAGRLYVPRQDFSPPVGPSGLHSLSIGANLEHLGAALTALWRGYEHHGMPLRECLPRLIALEEARPQRVAAFSFDRRLGGYSLQLLTTACEYGIRRSTRAVPVDDLRAMAGLGDISDSAYQRSLIDLRNSGAVTLVGEPAYKLTLSVGAFDWFARQRFANYDALRVEFDALIKAVPRTRSNAVADQLHVPLRFADHLFELLHEEGLHRVAVTTEGELRIKADWELW